MAIPKIGRIDFTKNNQEIVSQLLKILLKTIKKLLQISY